MIFFLQMRSCLQVLGVRMWAYLFGGPLFNLLQALSPNSWWGYQKAVCCQLSLGITSLRKLPVQGLLLWAAHVQNGSKWIRRPALLGPTWKTTTGPLQFQHPSARGWGGLYSDCARAQLLCLTPSSPPPPASPHCTASWGCLTGTQPKRRRWKLCIHLLVHSIHLIMLLNIYRSPTLCQVLSFI